MKRAILMARVSSEEQAKGYSLDVQEDNLRRYCEKKNIEIVNIWREDHSAKTFNRPEFQKLLSFLKINRGKIDFLLFTSWDRFSRNTTDAYDMIRRLNKLGIEPQAIEQPIDYNIPEMKAMLAIYLALPEIDNDRRSMKIKGGIRGAWKAGRWTHKAPTGYKNSRDENNKPLIVPNEYALNVRYVFRQVSNGKPQAEIRHELRTKGFIISKSGISSILRNPIYFGKIFVPEAEGQLAYLADGVHEPLISERLFYKVQRILNNQIEKRRQPKTLKKREELPLRGFLLCPNCGLKLTGSASRSRNKSRYFYYHCNRCGKVRIRADYVNSIFEGILNELKFKKESQELYLEIIKQIFTSRESDRDDDAKELTGKLEQQKQRVEKLQDMLVDNKISLEDYNKMKSRFDGIKEELLVKLRQIKSIKRNFERYLESGINLLVNLGKFYNNADIDTRQQLIGSIFPEKLVFTGGKVRTARINEVLRLILLNDKGSHEMQKGQLTSNLWLSSGVEIRGNEPALLSH
jgi:DNA invertase Pin-like site-specific DNA recombinase